MSDPVEVLKAARANFVGKRRAMAEQMVPAGAAGQHFAPNFVELQGAIEAIDRAIADERDLPAGYGPEEGSRLELATLDGAPVDREFDPA